MDPSLANLFVAWNARGPARSWWLAAALLVLADRVLTFSYVIPTMLGGWLTALEAFASRPLSP